MEDAVSDKLSKSSYTYWLREAQQDAAPLPVPQKLTPEDVLSNRSRPATLGSVWNRAGTWEEKNLDRWASDRIKVLMLTVGFLEFPSGKASLTDVAKCTGDAFSVTVRNKKRVGYTFELTLKFEGEWLINEKRKTLNGHMDILEFSCGELDDLEIEVRFDEVGFSHEEKQKICQDLRLFLHPIRERLLQFELELKDH